MGRTIDFFWGAFLPHKCSFPNLGGTPHLCGSVEFCCAHAPMGSLESCPLPKQVIGVWQIVDVIGQISRKLVELDVVVSEQHRLGALAAHIVPLTARIGDNTIGVPGPIALND